MKFIHTIVLTLTILCFGLKVGAQSADTSNYPYWIEMMKDPNANFFQTQRAFELYWENRAVNPGSGYKPFKRWEHRMNKHVDELGNKPSPSKTYSAIQNLAVPKSLNGNWHPLGPNFNQTTSQGDIPGVGRINTIAFHPTDPNTIYLGAPAGGLWSSTDNGQSWSTTTDQLATLGVSAIAIDPVNPNVIYIGTGDRDADDAPGLGVFKSTDGGQSFVQTNTGMGDRTVNEMRIHPDSNEVIIAATSSGMYRSTDAGANWTKTSVSTSYIDFEFKPDDPSIIYAVRSNRLEMSYDGGLSWAMVPNVPIKSRMFVAVTPADPNRVYVLIANQLTFAHMYRSDDGGATFYEIADSPNILGRATDGSDSDGQAWYDMCIEADPVDPDVVYVGGIRVFKSSDGGATWLHNSDGVHVDMHYLRFSPHTNELYLGNDGGIYRSDVNNAGWTDISNNMVIGQIYKIGQSQTNPNDIITGFQDNGTMLFDGVHWVRGTGGDGMECAYDPIDDNYIYSTIYYGSIYRSNNGGANFPRIAGNGVNNITESGAWVTPFCIGEHNNGTMYAGYANAWRTVRLKEADKDSVLWEQISTTFGTGTCSVIEHSPADSNLLYVVKSNKIYRSNNCNDVAANVTWTTINGSGTITDLEAHPTDTSVLWKTVGDNVFISDNQGQSWINITGNLPAITKTCIVHDVESNYGVYVGTTAGVYYIDSTMTQWESFGDGMPASSEITELEIYYGAGGVEKKLRASTYGRGLWESDLRTTAVTNFPSTPLMFMGDNNLKKEVYTDFEVDVVFYKQLENVDVTGFDVSDVAVSNATLNGISGGPAEYTLNLSPISPGVISMYISDSVILDLDTIPNLESDTFYVYYNDQIPQLGYTGPGGVGSDQQLALWLSGQNDVFETAGGTALISDSVEVESWEDRSIYQIDVSQSNPNRKPLFRMGVNGVSGLNAIEFKPDTSTNSGDNLVANQVVPGKNFAVLSVAQSNTNPFNHHAWLGSARTPNGYIIHSNKNSNSFYPVVIDQNEDYWGGPTISVPQTEIPHIYGFAFCENPITGYMLTGYDGNDEERGNDNFGGRDEVTPIDINLGWDYNSRFGDGKIAEHFIYNTGLGHSHFKIVRNYLGSMYQIDLGDNDHFAHDNVYRFNLAGIGRENQFDYHNDAQGTGIVRMRNANSLEDSDYLLWADDNTSYDSWFGTATPLNIDRVERTWRVDETGEVGTVEIRIPVADLPSTSDHYVVLTSSVQDFSVNSYATQLNVNNDTLVGFIDFNDDVYFTIASANDLEIKLINEDHSTLDLTVYPNLSSGVFQVVVSDESEIEGELAIYNVLGQIVHHENVVGIEKVVREFSHLNSGKYIVKFWNSSNSQSKPLMIIK